MYDVFLCDGRNVNTCRKCIWVDNLAINNDDYGLVSGALVLESVEPNIPERLLPPCID